jgi:hypothetical protein
MTTAKAGDLHQARRLAWAMAVIPPLLAVALLAAWLVYRQDDFNRLTSEVAGAAIDMRNLPMLETRLAAARKAAIALSPASSDLAAEADLLEKTRAATASIGVRPQILELLPAVDLGAYHRLGVSLHAAIDSDQLIALFRIIEENRPTLWIGELNVAATSESPSSTPASLDVSMSIFVLRCGVGECREKMK